MRAIRRGALAGESRAIQIVATPAAGNDRALDTAARLREALRARGHRAVLEAFPDLDSLGRWAARGGTGCSLLICVGGDGTLEAAAVAALGRSVPLLPVPCGGDSLFARALGQPGRVDRVVDLLEHGDVVHVDVGVRNGELFLCQESYGLLSQIRNRAEANAGPPRTGWRHRLAYYGKAARHLLDTPLVPLQVSVDGRVVARDAVIVTVANVETYGAWLNLTPGASPIDGLLDVFVMRRASKRDLLSRLLEWQLRLSGTDPKALVCRGRRVSVVAPHHVRDQIDLMPRRLRVVVSAATAWALVRDLGGRVGGFRTGRRQVA